MRVGHSHQHDEEAHTTSTSTKRFHGWAAFSLTFFVAVARFASSVRRSSFARDAVFAAALDIQEDLLVSIQAAAATDEEQIRKLPYNATHLPALAFLHVGKTAGTTLSFQINGACMRPRICRKNRPLVKNETLTALAMKQYFHITQMDSFHPSTFDGYIVPTRNPIHRVVSAYIMSHLKNQGRRANNNAMQSRFYGKCYPTAYSLAEDGLAGPAPNTTITDGNCQSLSCTDLAYSAVVGQCSSTVFWHFYYNYKRYCDKMLQYLEQHPEKLVLVVRQEHLWKDWNDLHTMLGGSPMPPTNSKSIHDSRAYQEHNKTLSEQGYHNLCRVLWEEIQIYLQVLQKAINLNEHDVMEAVDSLQELCGDSLIVKDLL